LVSIAQTSYLKMEEGDIYLKAGIFMLIESLIEMGKFNEIDNTGRLIEN